MAKNNIHNNSNKQEDRQLLFSVTKKDFELAFYHSGGSGVI